MINQWNNLRHKKLKGFTLLEMLVTKIIDSPADSDSFCGNVYFVY